MQDSIMLAEWRELREEIRQRIDQRTKLTEIMVVLFSALISAASAVAATLNVYLFFAFVPFVTVFFMCLIKASYNRHRLITTYIREQIETSKMGFPIPWEVMHFETWFFNLKENQARKNNRAEAYSLFNVGVYLICSCFLTWDVLFNSDRKIDIPSNLYSYVLIVYLLVGACAVKYSLITQADIIDSKPKSWRDRLNEPKFTKILDKIMGPFETALKEFRTILTNKFRKKNDQIASKLIQELGLKDKQQINKEDLIILVKKRYPKDYQAKSEALLNSKYFKSYVVDLH